MKPPTSQQLAVDRRLAVRLGRVLFVVPLEFTLAQYLDFRRHELATIYRAAGERITPADRAQAAREARREWWAAQAVAP